MNKFERVPFSDLVGKKIISITKSHNNDELVFITGCGNVYRMYHDQYGGENVEINDICGDLNDLLYATVISAEEVTNEDETPEGVVEPTLYESFTWTFYKIDTRKGGVIIRWLGESNGYYSESVDLKKLVLGE